MNDQNGKPVTKAEVEAILWYGMVAVIVGGGAGIYLPVLMGKGVGTDALATYIFAMLAPFWVDALLYEEYWKKLSKVKKLRIGVGCALSAALALASLLGEHKGWGMPSAVVGAVLVLVVWFFLALYSGRFAPEPTIPPTGSIGGQEPSTSSLSGGGLPS